MLSGGCFGKLIDGFLDWSAKNLLTGCEDDGEKDETFEHPSGDEGEFEHGEFSRYIDLVDLGEQTGGKEKRD